MYEPGKTGNEGLSNFPELVHISQRAWRSTASSIRKILIKKCQQLRPELWMRLSGIVARGILVEKENMLTRSYSGGVSTWLGGTSGVSEVDILLSYRREFELCT